MKYVKISEYFKKFVKIEPFLLYIKRIFWKLLKEVKMKGNNKEVIANDN